MRRKGELWDGPRDVRTHAFHYFYRFLSRLPPRQSTAAQSWAPTHPQGTCASSQGSQDPLPELASRGQGQQSGLQGGP